MEKVSLGKLPITSENIKILQYTILGLILYVLITGQLRRYRQSKVYETAGTDPNAAFAIRVRQACNPSGVGWMIDFDTTFENDLMVIADEIGDVTKVSAAYEKLYNENMYNRLEKELNSKKFSEWLRRAQAAPTASQTPTLGLGKEIAAIRDTPIYSDVDSTKVVRIAKAGETVGTKVRAYAITGNGKTQTYWLIRWTTWLILENQGLILASDTKEI